MGPLQNHFQRIVVISLKRRSDRLNAFLLQKNFPPELVDTLEVFTAIDGHIVPMPAHWRSGEGAWGCMQSHRQVLQECIMEGIDSVLVLEDDALFVDDFLQKFQDFMKVVPDNWDSLMLGGQHIQPPVPQGDGIVKCINCQRTHAYAVRGRFLKDLFRTWVSSAGHCDHHMGPLHARYNVYAPEPFLVAQSASRSDITCREEKTRIWSKGSRAGNICLVSSAPREVIGAYLQAGTHVGYWVDEHGYDRGLLDAFKKSAYSAERLILTWWNHVKFEAASLDRTTPLLWHPDAEKNLDLIKKALPGVKVKILDPLKTLEQNLEELS